MNISTNYTTARPSFSGTAYYKTKNEKREIEVDSEVMEKTADNIMGDMDCYIGPSDSYFRKYEDEYERQKYEKSLPGKLVKAEKLMNKLSELTGIPKFKNIEEFMYKGSDMFQFVNSEGDIISFIA